MNERKEKTRRASAPKASKASRVKRGKNLRAEPVIFTIGHSNRTIEDFLELLAAHGIQRLVDVRTIPRSRHNPQFNDDSLKNSVQEAGIAYTHMKNLGGLRHASRDSINTGWRNASFRGFADHMQTPEFDAGLTRLIALAEKKTCAIMCAEAVPWRCHRSLIADALTVRGFLVEHIMSRTDRQKHSLTSFARVHGTEIKYPSPDTA